MGSERDPSGGTIEEADAEIVLERLDLLGDSRLREKEMFGRFAEV